MTDNPSFTVPSFSEMTGNNCLLTEKIINYSCLVITLNYITVCPVLLFCGYKCIFGWFSSYIELSFLQYAKVISNVDLSYLTPCAVNL
jgi:hypothetical protein